MMGDEMAKKKQDRPDLELYKVKFSGINDLGNKTIEWIFFGAMDFNDAVRMINEYADKTDQEINEVHFVGSIQVSLEWINSGGK
jgi:hypothetical protein